MTVKVNTIVPGGSRIAHLRVARALSQEQLARRVGVTQSAISQAERGNPVRTKTLTKLARALGVTVGDLIDKTTTVDPDSADGATSAAVLQALVNKINEQAAEIDRLNVEVESLQAQLGA